MNQRGKPFLPAVFPSAFSYGAPAVSTGAEAKTGAGAEFLVERLPSQSLSI